MKKNRRTQWLKLDNAAKIFPATSGKKDTKVFRLACELKEKVLEEQLNIALEKTVNEFPVFRSVLRRGLFWYYLETVERKVSASIENDCPCSPLYDKNKRNFLFRVTYYENRINLEVHHALTDGVGAKMFLTTLVCHYLKLVHMDELNGIEIEAGYIDSIEERMDDSFKRYYDDKSTDKKQIEIDSSENCNTKPRFAYRLHGTKLSENRIKVIEGHVSVQAVKQKAKEYHTSVTAYLVALLLTSISDAMSVREKRKPVGIMVPVNLRTYFKSSSVRNFFATINVSYDFNKRSGEFEDIISVVEQCFKQELTKENMHRNLNRNGALGNSLATRFVPLSIKDFFIRIAYAISDQQYTCSLSNIGIFTVPKEVEQYIRCFSVFVSTKKKQACMCSYQDELVIGFTSPLLATEVERNFIRKLTDMGLQVEVAATSGWED